jgi:predicted transposase/invertase (TIGR01784 family)
VSKYINPYIPYCFKFFWGEKRSKELLIDFLNQSLPQQHQIAELHFSNNQKLSDLPDKRRAYFDIQCRSTFGESFIVQFHQAEVNFFKDLSLFYSNSSICDQEKWSKPWYVEQMDVYFIAILDFEYDENEERRKFLRHVQLKDQDGDLFYNKLHFKFLQMPLFTKREHELGTRFDKWVYFLKNLSKFDHIPAILKEPIFEKAFHTAEVSNMSEAQHRAYEKSWLDYISMNAVVSSALDQGVEKGIKQGIEIGKEQGIEIGFDKGRAEAEQKAQVAAEKKDYSLVLRLHAKGMSANEIAELTGLSAEKIMGIVADIAD